MSYQSSYSSFKSLPYYLKSQIYFQHPHFFQDYCLLLHEEKRGHIFILSPFDLRNSLCSFLYFDFCYFPYLNLLFSVSEGKKIYHLLLSFIPFSSESVSILIKPSYKSFPNQSSRKKTFHISVQVRKLKEKALHSLYYRTDAGVLSLTFKAIYYLVPS